MTQVGILETVRHHYSTDNHRRDTPKIIHQFFTEQDGLRFRTYHVSGGDSVPDVGDCDAWIITGSANAVYEHHTWIPPLENLARASVERNVPMLGICFGHQLMAQAFGGKVVQSDKGRGIGIHTYRLSEAGQFLLPESSEMHLIASHQDQVVVPPPDGVLLAGSDFCPYAAFSYGASGLSLQPHPEYTVAISRDIIGGYEEHGIVDAAQVAAAEESFKAWTPDSEKMLPALRKFLTKAH